MVDARHPLGVHPAGAKASRSAPGGTVTKVIPHVRTGRGARVTAVPSEIPSLPPYSCHGRKPRNKRPVQTGAPASAPYEGSVRSPGTFSVERRRPRRRSCCTTHGPPRRRPSTSSLPTPPRTSSEKAWEIQWGLCNKPPSRSTRPPAGPSDATGKSAFGLTAAASRVGVGAVG